MTVIELRATEAVSVLPRYLKDIADAIKELNETLKVLYAQERQAKSDPIKEETNGPEEH